MCNLYACAQKVCQHFPRTGWSIALFLPTCLWCEYTDCVCDEILKQKGLLCCSSYCVPRTSEVWQSRVQVKGYSVVYFDHIAAFYRWTSINGVAHTCFVDAWIPNEISKHVWATVLNGSSAIRHFEGSDAIKISDEITFDFYMGLPQVNR